MREWTLALSFVYLGSRSIFASDIADLSSQEAMVGDPALGVTTGSIDPDHFNEVFKMTKFMLKNDGAAGITGPDLDVSLKNDLNDEITEAKRDGSPPRPRSFRGTSAKNVGFVDSLDANKIEKATVRGKPARSSLATQFRMEMRQNPEWNSDPPTRSIKGMASEKVKDAAAGLDFIVSKDTPYSADTLGSTKISDEASAYVTPDDVSNYQTKEKRIAAQIEVLSTLDDTHSPWGDDRSELKDLKAQEDAWPQIDAKASFTDPTATALRRALKNAKPGSKEHVKLQHKLEAMIFERTGAFESSKQHLLKHSMSRKHSQDPETDIVASYGDHNVERLVTKEKRTVSQDKYAEMLRDAKSMVHNEIIAIDRDENDDMSQDVDARMSNISGKATNNASSNITGNTSNGSNSSRHASDSKNSTVQVVATNTSNHTTNLCVGNSRSDEYVDSHMRLGSCDEMAQKGLCMDVDIADLLADWCEKSCRVGNCRDKADGILANFTTVFSQSLAARQINEKKEHATAEYETGKLELQIEEDRIQTEGKDAADEKHAKSLQMIKRKQEKHEKLSAMSDDAQIQKIVDLVTRLHEEAVFPKSTGVGKQGMEMIAGTHRSNNSAHLDPV